MANGRAVPELVSLIPIIFVPLIVCLALAVLWRRRVLAVLTVVALAVMGWWHAGYFIPSARVSAAAQTAVATAASAEDNAARIMTLNTLAGRASAEEIVKIAKQEGATAIGHGCTGKGNDQLRFDFIFRMHGFDIVAPMREHNMTRDWEIDYAEQHGIPIPVKKSTPWSVDENIWSRSIEGGRLEETDYHPPEEIYHWTTSPEAAPDKPEIVSITFENGVPVALNGKKMNGVDLIVELNTIAGRNGVGRNDMVEDRVLGLKARENYEHPAATVLIAAHADLEKLVLSRFELKFKHIVDDQWAELAYMGLVHEPLYHDLNAFIDETQKRVTGTVDVQLFKGGLHILGRKSPNAIYSQDMVSFDTTTIDQRDAIGFSKYFGLQGRMVWQLQNK